MTTTVAIPAPELWNRIRIKGRLKLETPMTVGDGTTRPGEKNEDGTMSQVARIALTPDGKAMIPGSSLKGVLRAYLGNRGISKNVVDRLFGKPSLPKDASGQSPDSGRGGSLEFGFAYSKRCFTSEQLNDTIEQSVAIDRVTRTASDRQLFACETVPAGTEFDIELLGFQISATEIGAILFGLEGFNDTRIRSGSDPEPRTTMAVQPGSRLRHRACPTKRFSRGWGRVNPWRIIGKSRYRWMWLRCPI